MLVLESEGRNGVGNGGRETDEYVLVTLGKKSCLLILGSAGLSAITGTASAGGGVRVTRGGTGGALCSLARDASALTAAVVCSDLSSRSAILSVFSCILSECSCIVSNLPKMASAILLKSSRT